MSNNMTRAEAYAKIKELDLAKQCVETYGKNFTMCKTDQLIALINKVEKIDSNPKKVEAPITKEEVPSKHKENPKGGTVAPTTGEGCELAIKLVELLCNKGVISRTEAKKLGVEISVPRNTSPYSDDEINNMFKNI